MSTQTTGLLVLPAFATYSVVESAQLIDIATGLFKPEVVIVDTVPRLVTFRK